MAFHQNYFVYNTHKQDNNMGYVLIFASIKKAVSIFRIFWWSVLDQKKWSFLVTTICVFYIVLGDTDVSEWTAFCMVVKLLLKMKKNSWCGMQIISIAEQMKISLRKFCRIIKTVKYCMEVTWL